MVLLLCTGLFIKGMINMSSADFGFANRNMLLLTVDPASRGYDESRRKDFYQKAGERIRAIPGVRSASMAASVPFENFDITPGEIYVEGLESLPETKEMK